MEIAVFIQNIQEERAEVALYIFSNQTSATINSTMNKDGNRMGLAERFQQTDRALEEVPTWPDVKIMSNTVKHRNNGHLNNGMHWNNWQSACSGVSK